MYVLAKEVLGRTDAAVLAGMIFAFHTYNFHEVPRIQLLSAQWFPLALLHLHRTFLTGRRRDAALFGLYFVLQGLANTYYLFYFALLLAFWIPAYAIFLDGGWRRVSKLIPPIGVAGAVFGLLAIPYLRMLRD